MEKKKTQKADQLTNIWNLRTGSAEGSCEQEPWGRKLLAATEERKG